jgi:hypothetical protein
LNIQYIGDRDKYTNASVGDIVYHNIIDESNFVFPSFERVTTVDYNNLPTSWSTLAVYPAMVYYEGKYYKVITK